MEWVLLGIALGGPVVLMFAWAFAMASIK